MRADRDLAAAAQGAEAPTLRQDGRMSRRMVERLACVPPGAALARLDSEGALADRRAHHVDGQDLGDAIGPAQAFQTSGGEQDSVVLSFVQLSESRVEITADGLDADVRPQLPQLRGAPQAPWSYLRG